MTAEGVYVLFKEIKAASTLGPFAKFAAGTFPQIPESTYIELSKGAQCAAVTNPAIPFFFAGKPKVPAKLYPPIVTVNFSPGCNSLTALVFAIFSSLF